MTLVFEVDDRWSIANIVKYTTPEGWAELFVRRAAKEIEDIDKKISTAKVVPKRKDLFKIFHMLRPEEIKVVIIGQDPYPRVGVANGMAFSVERGIQIPSSLQNIFKELQRTISEFKYPSHGDLTNWVRQGVFLMNSALTTLPEVPGAHSGLWFGFALCAIEEIQQKSSRVIFLLWGRVAQDLAKYLSSSSIILKAPHPSGMNGGKFIGCDHFRQVNEKLKSLGKKEIDWNLD
jgi:uracil-DNA glycosylase